MTEIKVADGKYTVVHENGANLRALRYGEPWRDLVGDGLVLALAQEIEDLRQAAQPTASAEPVAVVGSVYQLLWAGNGDFPALIKRHELKPGSKLYAAPVAAQPQPSGNSGELPGYTVADMASASAQGWRDGYAAALMPERDAVDLAREGMELHKSGQPEYIVCAELVRIADAARAQQSGDTHGR